MNVEQLRQLEQAATPGEWSTHHRDDVDWLTKSVQARGKDADDHEPGSLAGPVWPKEQHPAFCSGWPHRNARADAELIAAMRNALPALLDIAEAAQRHHNLVNDGWDLGMEEHSTDPEWWAGWEIEREKVLDELAAALSRLDTEVQR